MTSRNITTMASYPDYEILYFQKLEELNLFTYHVQNLYTKINELEEELQSVYQENDMLQFNKEIKE